MGGCSYSLENMLQSVRDVVKPYILFRDYGAAYDYFVQKGYECIVIPFKLNILPKDFNYLKYPFRYLYDKWYNYKACKKIEKLVSLYSIQIIHSNTSVMTIGIEAALKCKVKHVWHFREFQDLDFGMKPFCGMSKFRSLMEKSDLNLSISESVQIHWGLDKFPNSRVIRNAVMGIDDACYVENKEKYILFCSALLIKTKGVELALRIFASSQIYKKGYRIVFVGKIVDEVLMSRLYDFIRDNGLKDCVDFVGYKRDLSSYVKNATAFLMCSDNEALGRVTVEAMFWGCPVIAKNSGGSKEFIKHGYNGFLFNNVEDGALMLSSLVDMDCRQVILNANKTAKESFSIEGFGLMMIKLYRDLL